MPSPHREPLLTNPSAETHPRVVQKSQVRVDPLSYHHHIVHVVKVQNVCLRYFPLLAKQRPNQPECGVLLNVFALLSAKNASPVTIGLVMDVAESLATAEDFVASETETELSVNACVFPEPQEGSLVTAGCWRHVAHFIGARKVLSNSSVRG